MQIPNRPLREAALVPAGKVPKVNLLEQIHQVSLGFPKDSSHTWRSKPQPGVKEALPQGSGVGELVNARKVNN